MIEKDLIRKLNNLGKINPDQDWLNSNRELLLSQISNSGAENLSVWKVILIKISSLSKTAVQPAYALVAFVFLLTTGFLLSQNALSNTKPSNSLYIARIIAEKVKLNTTFNSAERDKLAVQYATDHAQAISAVLADPNFNTPANQAQVAALNNSFAQEVSTVKSGINRLASGSKATAKPAASVNPAPVLAVSTKPSDKATSADLIIADSSKDQQGIQLLEKNNDGKLEVLNTEKVSGTLKDMNIKDSGITTVASTSSSTLQAEDSSKVKATPSDADEILDEAQKLFDQKNYNQASDKLKEVDKIIE
jgi:hypothetical protein